MSDDGSKIYIQIAHSSYGIIFGLNTTDGTYFGPRYQSVSTCSNFTPIKIFNSIVYVGFKIAGTYTLMLFDMSLTVSKVFQAPSVIPKGI